MATPLVADKVISVPLGVYGVAISVLLSNPVYHGIMLKVQLVVPPTVNVHGLGLEIIVPVTEFARVAVKVEVMPPLPPLIVAVKVIGVVPIMLAGVLPDMLLITIVGVGAGPGVGVGVGLGLGLGDGLGAGFTFWSAIAVSVTSPCPLLYFSVILPLLATIDGSFSLMVALVVLPLLRSDGLNTISIFGLFEVNSCN